MKAIARQPADSLQGIDVSIPVKGGTTLEGSLQIPGGARGIVLFAHGSGSSRHSPSNRFVARTLRESGMATLLFDLLTPREERDEDSTGACRFDMELLAGRLVEATRWLKHLPDAAALPVGYFGSSTGGGAALVAVPTAAPGSYETIQSEVDDLVALTTPGDFHAIGQFYENFLQVSDKEVTRLLEAAGKVHRHDPNNARLMKP